MDEAIEWSKETLKAIREGFERTDQRFEKLIDIATATLAVSNELLSRS